MQTNVTIQQNLSPEQLAKALAEATPDEFSMFWFEFHNQMEKNQNHKKLNEFAKAMVPDSGANRKIVFYKLYKLMQFYEVEKDMD